MNKQNTGKTPFPAHRVRRSVKLTANELIAFRAYVDDIGTYIDAAAELGFASRSTVSDIYTKGTGAHDSIVKIREKLGVPSIN